MRCAILYLFLPFLIPAICVSQVRVIKPVKTYPTTTDLGFGVGVTSSAIFLGRNTADRNNAHGIVASLVYGGSKLFRFSLDYTHYDKIDIAPTWYHVNANTIEANMHIMYKSKSNLYFYPLFGLSYNVFAGYFTGKDDYLNLNSIYPRNHEVTTRWLGVNAGVGLEYVVRPIVIFANYKMRVGVSSGYNTVNILDVCFSIGVRYNLVVPSIYSLFRGTRSRYFLDKRSRR